MSRASLDEHVAEVLKNFGSRQRFSGVVSKINRSTTFIKSEDREFLAWSRPDLVVGANVEFSIDQLQAVRIKVQKIPAYR